jgi:hypothetical protein
MASGRLRDVHIEAVIVILPQRSQFVLVFVVADLNLDLGAALGQHLDLDGLVTAPLDRWLLRRKDDWTAAIALHD